MARFFNTTGLCKPEKHYMQPAEGRLPDLGPFFEDEAYFVVHAPRQSGKTTSFHHLARRLTAEGRYAAVLASCETGRVAQDDLDRGVTAVIDAIFEDASLDLPEELRPEQPTVVSSVAAETRLKVYLRRWCEKCPRPVVLFLDEIDALSGKSLLSVLHQLRAGYRGRPESFPQSMALIGLRDVRDYRMSDPTQSDDPVRRELQQVLGTSSPFNIKVESLTLRNFTAEEVAELYEQHTAETSQAFSGEAKELAWGLTRGQPWLVNALARQVVRYDVTDRVVEITAEHVEAAKETLILRRDTHLDSLAKRLREQRVRRVVEPILSGEYPSEEIPEDDVDFVIDLGLVARAPGGLGIANPIYREVIPRALTSVTEDFLPVDPRDYIADDGHLLRNRLLDGFVDFWREHAESFLGRQPYAEAAGQLIFMAWMQRIVNSGGYIDREYALGSGRIDLLVRWPLPDGTVQRFALELKVWRTGKADPQTEGLEQLTRYLGRLGLTEGTLVIFDQRASAPPFAERGTRETVRHGDCDVLVLRL